MSNRYEIAAPEKCARCGAQLPGHVGECLEMEVLDIVERLRNTSDNSIFTASMTGNYASYGEAADAIVDLRKELQLSLSILDNVGGFLDDFAQADLDEGAADAVTVGMVYQQQAQTVVLPRITNRITALRAALAKEPTP